MTGPDDLPKGTWQRRYRLLLGVARAAVAWERLWPCLWPAAGVVAVFVSVALLDLLPMLPFWLHSLALVLFAAAFGFMARGAARNYRAVDEKTAEHRLERDSGLDHRPLMALHDRLVTGLGDAPGNADTQGLWRIHLRRMAEAASRLRVALPSPGLARRDPYGLRAVVLLFLVIAAAAGGGNAWGRLERALVPRLDVGLHGPMELDLWITPPAYTGLAPMFLERPPVLAAVGNGQGEDGQKTQPPPIEAPVGSALLAQARAAARPPELVIGDKIIQFAAIGKPEGNAGGGRDRDGSYRVETILENADNNADTLEIRAGGRTLASWALRVVVDRPPEVEFTRAPGRTGRAQFRLDYEARDDYGLAGLQVVIRHPDGLSVPGGQSAIRAELPLPGLGSNRVEGSSVQDFSAHPWAGLPVLVRLQALDARGQAGESDAIKVVLPERIFNHPVARAIAEARKKLNNPSDAVVAEVVGALRDITSRPKHFFDDTIVFLALSVAASRLIHDESDTGIGAVQALLWETALRIEDGEFAIAERDLKKIQDQLMRALRKGKDAQEIERLMDDLRAALDKYLAALAEHLEKQGLSQLPFNPSSRSLEGADLQRMIEEARELARTGSLEAARRMLADLKRMLDGIRQGMQAGKPRKDMARAKRIMDALRSLNQRQQKQLDETFRRQRETRDAQGAMSGRPGQGGKKGKADLERKKGNEKGARDQQALRRDLGKLMLRMDEFLGDNPSAFGKAERAMNDAARALEKGKLGDAVPRQTEALDQLRQGMEGMAEQLARRMGGAFGVSRGRGRGPMGGGNDPFGRAPGGAFGSTIDDGNVKIPDQMERRQARDILQELRRRSGERNRPAGERDYIERLLKRF